MRVQKYMNDRLLKSTEPSTVVEIENSGTEVAKDEVVESNKTQTEAKIVKIDMKPLVATFLYPECNPQVDIKNAAPSCNNCKIVSLKNMSKEKASVQMIVTYVGKVSFKISVAL